ncbi:MAG: amidohydrolase family protein [Acidobacteria bacterium]|nr:amidohydrolase family protein [Acidobacteriota bacterium]
MSSLCIRGARQLLTLRGAAEPRLGPRMMDLGVVPDGSVLIRDGCIVETGTTRRVANLSAYRNAEVIDASGCVVMPGFVDPAVDLLGIRGTLPSLVRRAIRLVHHGTTTAGALSRQRKPLHCDEALAAAGLDVAWDVSWEPRCGALAHTPLRNMIEGSAPEPVRAAIQQGKLAALSSGFQEPGSPACSMLASVSVACLNGDLRIEEAIVAATTNAAHLLGLGRHAGSLDPGRPADLLILDVGDYTKIPFHLGEHLIRAVIKRGKLVCRFNTPAPYDISAE